MGAKPDQHGATGALHQARVGLRRLRSALSIFALAALMLGAFFGKDRIAGAVLWLTVAALLVAAFAVGWTGRADGQAFFGMFIDDAFARFAKVTALAAAAAAMRADSDGWPASPDPPSLTFPTPRPGDHHPPPPSPAQPG